MGIRIVFSEAEQCYVRQNYKKIPNREIYEKLGISRFKFYGLIREIGLKPNSKKGSNKKESTLCWECARAAGDIYGCPKIKNDKPVPGWTAERVTVPARHYSNGKERTIHIPCWRVISCPLFVEG